VTGRAAGPAEASTVGAGAARPCSLRVRDVDREPPAAERLAAELRDRRLGLRLRGHLHEAEAPPHSPGADPRARADRFPLLPKRILADLQDALGPEDLVVSDVGAHKLWVAQCYGARLPNTVIISNGFAAMGIGLPGAIAAKLASPTRRVVTVTGDGGLLMNVQELETARHLGLAFVVLIFRDDGYGVIRWKQQRRFGRRSTPRLGLQSRC
jgi:thiamine pyrophosphate-dependent acetolactate synthase large subunit-like protein